MRSPTYYDSKTLAVCVSEGGAGNLEALVKALDAKIAKNSNFVSVSYRTESRDKAIRCLEQVLVVVVEKQKALAENNFIHIMSSLDNTKKKVDGLRKSVKQLESDRSAQFKFKNVEYSAVALITVTLESKNQQLLATENEIFKIESMLKPPTTQEAKFGTPIFASEQRESPRRSLIVMFSAMASLFFGVLILLLRRGFSSFKKRREEQHKSASITS